MYLNFENITWSVLPQYKFDTYVLNQFGMLAYDFKLINLRDVS